MSLGAAMKLAFTAVTGAFKIRCRFLRVEVLPRADPARSAAERKITRRRWYIW
jgi:hypothetical protein